MTDCPRRMWNTETNVEGTMDLLSTFKALRDVAPLEGLDQA
ncbi:hypothetical protein ABT373_04300 [Streptomyces sp. NPDC000070]